MTKLEIAILSACLKYKKLPFEILNEQKNRDAIWPRQYAMFVYRQFGKSYPEIGKDFGCDHTTALNNVRRVEERLKLGIIYMYPIKVPNIPKIMKPKKTPKLIGIATGNI